MEEHHKEMRALGNRLLDVFFEALGLTAEQIAAGETERKIRETLVATMHLNLYIRPSIFLLSSRRGSATQLCACRFDVGVVSCRVCDD